MGGGKANVTKQSGPSLPKNQKKMIRTYSETGQISAIVPPTIVAPVDANEPCKNRPTITVWIFFALIKGGGRLVSGL